MGTTSNISALSTTMNSMTTDDILQETETTEGLVTSIPVSFTTIETGK